MIANTWAAVHRGDDANVYADPTDLDQPVVGLERVPLSIIEQSRTVYDPETNEPRIIRYATGRGRGDLDIRTDDRILDLRTSRWWLVRSRSVPDGFTGYGARTLQLDLRAV